jgi:hypothetical protein
MADELVTMETINQFHRDDFEVENIMRENLYYCMTDIHKS